MAGRLSMTEEYNFSLKIIHERRHTSADKVEEGYVENEPLRGKLVKMEGHEKFEITRLTALHDPKHVRVYLVTIKCPPKTQGFIPLQECSDIGPGEVSKSESNSFII